MYCVKLLIGEGEGGNPCFMMLPPEFNDADSGIRCEVIQCTCLASDGGCAMIRINDPGSVLSGVVDDRIYYENDNGECAIDRISSHQFMAMVMNNNCQLSRILSESGCFITSAIIEGEDICWTVVGPNSTYVRNLVDRLKMEGFIVRKKSSFSTDFAALLSERQEEALRTALAEGYYEIPRKTKMDDLCKILNCSKSTLDITLRTAERKIITHYILQNRETVINRKK